MGFIELKTVYFFPLVLDLVIVKIGELCVKYYRRTIFPDVSFLHLELFQKMLPLNKIYV